MDHKFCKILISSGMTLQWVALEHVEKMDKVSLLAMANQPFG
jgi:hypothetical protein